MHCIYVYLCVSSTLQCLLSLSDTLEPQQGGFECVPGFHREWREYYSRQRDKMLRAKKNMKQDYRHPLSPPASSSSSSSSSSSPRGVDCSEEPIVCVGDFSPLSSLRDAALLARFTHIPIPAGAAVFWDQRIPHANARENRNAFARCVVYGGFLPRTSLNRRYGREQWRRMKKKEVQVDFWLEERNPVDEGTGSKGKADEEIEEEEGGGGGGGGEGEGKTEDEEYGEGDKEGGKGEI